MDVKIVNLQKNKLEKVSTYSKEQKDKYLTDFLYMGLGLKIILKNFQLCDEINDTVDYLCIDEAYRLVLVEKRVGKDTRTIRSGLMYIDYIKENISKIKILISDHLGVDILKDICYDPRLVILTESFSSYDFSAIKCMPYTIEAINYYFLDNNLVFIKEYQNKPIDFLYYSGFRSTLYIELERFLSLLGDDISIFGYKNVITIRKIKAFMYIIPQQDKLTIYLNNKEYIIKDYNNLYKLEDKIEQAYDEN